MKWFTLTVGMAIGLLGMSLTALAQPQKNQPVPQPLPPGPLLNRAPEFSSWTMSISSAQVAPKSPDAPQSKPPVELRRLTVTKTKNVYREERQFSDGSTRETWRVGSMQISTLPHSSELIVFEPAAATIGLLDPEDYTNYSKTDFPGFEWISKRNYRGVQKIMDTQCLVFGDSLDDISEETRKAMAEAAGEVALPQIQSGRSATAAWIDLQTRLPMALQKGNKKEVFQFSAPPQAMLALPPKMQHLLDRRAKAVEMLTRRPAKP